MSGVCSANRSGQADLDTAAANHTWWAAHARDNVIVWRLTPSLSQEMKRSAGRGGYEPVRLTLAVRRDESEVASALLGAATPQRSWPLAATRRVDMPQEEMPCVRG